MTTDVFFLNSDQDVYRLLWKPAVLINQKLHCVLENALCTIAGKLKMKFTF